MSSKDPYAFMHEVAKGMNELHGKTEIESVLDELEYLFEIIPPDLQDGAEKLIAMLREKLAKAG